MELLVNHSNSNPGAIYIFQKGNFKFGGMYPVYSATNAPTNTLFRQIDVKTQNNFPNFLIKMVSYYVHEDWNYQAEEDLWIQILLPILKMDLHSKIPLQNQLDLRNFSLLDLDLGDLWSP